MRCVWCWMADSYSVVIFWFITTHPVNCLLNCLPHITTKELCMCAILIICGTITWGGGSPFYDLKWHWIWVWINNYIHALLWIISPIHSLTFVNIWVFIISIYDFPPLLKIRLLMYILGGGWTHRKGIHNSQPIQYDKITNLGRQGTNLKRIYITDSIFNGN